RAHRAAATPGLARPGASPRAAELPPGCVGALPGYAAHPGKRRTHRDCGMRLLSECGPGGGYLRGLEARRTRGPGRCDAIPVALHAPGSVPPLPRGPQPPPLLPGNGHRTAALGRRWDPVERMAPVARVSGAHPGPATDAHEGSKAERANRAEPTHVPGPACASRRRPEPRLRLRLRPCPGHAPRKQERWGRTH